MRLHVPANYIFNLHGMSKLWRMFLSTAVPTIEEDVSPPFVICEMGTLCLLFCYATSEYPRTMMYSWTKNGISLTDGDGFKIISNSVVVRPHRMEDYGVYACKASNGIHATTYNITLGVKLNSSAVVFRREENESESRSDCIVQPWNRVCSSVLHVTLDINCIHNRKKDPIHLIQKCRPINYSFFLHVN